MKKAFSIIVMFLLVFTLTGCAETPVYQVEGEVEVGSYSVIYITVSGEYNNAGLKKVCKELDLNDEIENHIFFFAPNAPRDGKFAVYYDKGLPDPDYKIASFVMEDGKIQD